MIKQLIVLSDSRSARKRERLVSTVKVGDDIGTEGRWFFEARDGGSVANAYGYKTDTQARGLIVCPEGRAVVAYGQLRANKVTERGAAGATIVELAVLVDKRRKVCEVDQRPAKLVLIRAYEPWLMVFRDRSIDEQWAIVDRVFQSPMRLEAVRLAHELDLPRLVRAI